MHLNAIKTSSLKAFVLKTIRHYSENMLLKRCKKYKILLEQEKTEYNNK